MIQLEDVVVGTLVGWVSFGRVVDIGLIVGVRQEKFDVLWLVAHHHADMTWSRESLHHQMTFLAGAST